MNTRTPHTEGNVMHALTPEAQTYIRDLVAIDGGENAPAGVLDEIADFLKSDPWEPKSDLRYDIPVSVDCGSCGEPIVITHSEYHSHERAVCPNGLCGGWADLVHTRSNVDCPICN